jgi:CRISPR-associated endoribonuclease Cas6
MRKYCFGFECIKEGRVFGHGGAECHGLLFSLLHESCPGFSRDLHEAAVNPFSIGPLQGQGHFDKGAFYLCVGKEYYFTVSTLSSEMGAAIAGVKPCTKPGNWFRLGTADCRWLGVTEAAEKSYSQLLSADSPDRFVLDFVSPTCFRSQGISLLFPSPDLLFSSIMERWNTFTPIPLDFKILPFVSRYKLSTRLVQFPKYRMTGFIGTVEYSFPKAADSATRQGICTLAQYAGFTGIGYKTAMGMGENRYLGRSAD